MRPAAGFLVGLILGGILGFALGFLAGVVSKPEEEKVSRKESKAEKLFKLAVEQKDKKRKLELLGKLLDKYPYSEWTDKALEEVMKMKREGRS